MLKVLSTTSFGVQQSMVKMAMKSNVDVVMAKSHDVNPLMPLQCTLWTSIMFTCSCVKYFKLVKIVMVQVLGRVKIEWYFNFLTCCKSKLCNWLLTNLELVVRMCSQKFYTLHTFHIKSIWIVACKTFLIQCGNLDLRFSNLSYFWHHCKLQLLIRILCKWSWWSQMDTTSYL